MGWGGEEQLQTSFYGKGYCYVWMRFWRDWWVTILMLLGVMFVEKADGLVMLFNSMCWGRPNFQMKSLWERYSFIGIVLTSPSP